MHRLLFIATCVFCAFAFSNMSVAAPKIIDEHISQAEKIGEGKLTFLFKDIYTARLYAPEGKWREDASYALELRYNLGLKGRKIAERSITEMRKIGYDNEEQLSSWLNIMSEIFPDVRDGSVLTGILTADQETLFFNGDQKIGHVEDPLFGKAFFSIWLSEKTSEPELRQALMGLE